jgi:arylsulfatase A-like enzyme
MVLPHDPFVDTPDGTGTNGQTRFALMVNYMDKMVGKLLQKLKDTGLDSNTLVFFVGDNGTSRSITSIKDGVAIDGGKAHPDDAGTHVPFIARWPGNIAAGGTTDQIVDFASFVPTVAEAGGATIPDNIDGISIYKNLLDPDEPKKDWIYIWYDPEWGVWPRAVFARDQTYKLYEDGTFYDISQDVDEENSIAEGDGTPESEAARVFLQQIIDNGGHLEGCTDKEYAEFNPQADVDDGSCVTTATYSQKETKTSHVLKMRNDELVFSLNKSLSGPFRLELFDLQGARILKTETRQGKIRIKLTALKSMVYIARIFVDGEYFNLKVLAP